MSTAMVEYDVYMRKAEESVRLAKIQEKKYNYLNAKNLYFDASCYYKEASLKAWTYQDYESSKEATKLSNEYETKSKQMQRFYIETKNHCL